MSSRYKSPHSTTTSSQAWPRMKTRPYAGTSGQSGVTCLVPVWYTTSKMEEGIHTRTRENTLRTARAGERPDNQQERLVRPDWVVGFTDGEGCFSVGFVQQPDIPDSKRPLGRRKGYRSEYQVSVEYTVMQGERSKSILHQLQKFFGIGNIYVNRRHDNHKGNLYRYSVSRRGELRDVIIPFFQKYPLQTAKRRDLENFVRVVKLMERGIHKTKEGVVRIARIAQRMNHGKNRESLIRILNDHTPSLQKVE